MNKNICENIKPINITEIFIETYTVLPRKLGPQKS